MSLELIWSRHLIFYGAGMYLHKSLTKRKKKKKPERATV